MLLLERELERDGAHRLPTRVSRSASSWGRARSTGLAVSVRSPDGLLLSGRLRGYHQLRYAIEDILRAVDAGIRGFLIADTGLDGDACTPWCGRRNCPASIVWKISAVLAPSNPVTFSQLVDLGGTTVNVPSDITSRRARPRSARLSGAPIDLYLEAPDAMGGVVRGHELAEIAIVAAPLYAKFGLRNARPVYPAGEHLIERRRGQRAREGSPRGSSRSSGSTPRRSTSRSPSPAPKALEYPSYDLAQRPLGAR